MSELDDLRAEVARLRAEDERWQAAYLRLDQSHKRLLDQRAAVEALRARMHASKDRGAAYDAWTVTDLLDAALAGHICADPDAECPACEAASVGRTEPEGGERERKDSCAIERTRGPLDWCHTHDAQWPTGRAECDAIARRTQPAPEAVCAHNVGDPPEVCRCLLPRGHSGIHSCKHTVDAPDASAPFTRYSGTAGSKVDAALGGDET